MLVQDPALRGYWYLDAGQRSRESGIKTLIRYLCDPFPHPLRRAMDKVIKEIDTIIDKPHLNL